LNSVIVSEATWLVAESGEIGYGDVVIAGIGALDIRNGQRRVGHVSKVGILEMPLVTQRGVACCGHAEGDIGK
jgi:hypothetical protein